MRVFNLTDALAVQKESQVDKWCGRCNYEKEWYTTEKIHNLGSQELNHCVYHLMLEVQSLKEQLRKLQLEKVGR